MKIRNGFVSNSSSSSFIIDKNRITEEQIDKIYNHIEIDLKEFNGEFGCGSEQEHLNFPWEIKEKNEFLIGEVFMDNFDMRAFLENIIDRYFIIMWWHSNNSTGLTSEQWQDAVIKNRSGNKL